MYFALIIALGLIHATQSSATLCEYSSITNGSVVYPTAIRNYVTECSMESVTFRTDIDAILEIRQSTVGAGGVMRVVFGTKALRLQLLFTSFGLNARLVMEGTPVTGTGLTIESSSFDVRSPWNGDTIAIDLRQLTLLKRDTYLEVINNTINIASGPEVEGLVAAVALTPLEVELGDFLLQSCVITLNTSGVAYGLYYTAVTSNSHEIFLKSNQLYRPSDLPGAANSTAFFIRFLQATATGINNTALETTIIVANTIDRLGTFLDYAAIAVLVKVQWNTHSHHGPIVCTLLMYAPEKGSFEFLQNAFRTVYEPWNLDSTLANPLLSFWFSEVPDSSRVLIAHNEVHASRFVAIPFLFPGPTNLPWNSSLYMLGNLFTTSQLGDTSLSMSSFAASSSSPPRTVDLGTVYVCSNAWPATFVAATTTTTSIDAVSFTNTTVAPTTRTAVASPDTLSELVAPTDRPRNVTMLAGDCPTFISMTRRPNGAHAVLCARVLLSLLVFLMMSILQ